MNLESLVISKLHYCVPSEVYGIYRGCLSVDNPFHTKIEFSSQRRELLPLTCEGRLPSDVSRLLSHFPLLLHVEAAEGGGGPERRGTEQEEVFGVHLHRVAKGLCLDGGEVLHDACHR